MSAICGIVRFDGRPVERAEIASMVESSPSRGPDGSGYWIHRNAGFAHQAFHVTPESVHERQPLISANGRLVLCADARLDNREELFRKLEIPENPERVVTDPELILEAYRKWGERCVEHLLGDFVFSIWNAETQNLFLARDALGGFALTYRDDGPEFAFASETAAILDLAGVDPQINCNTVLRILTGIPLDSRDTCFDEVFFLPAAHCMVVSANGIRSWKHWEVDPERRITYRNEEQYCDHFLELLDAAVGCRLRATGPFGISLSGGCDSTLLAAIVARQLGGETGKRPPLRSFSYVFDEFNDCDESEYIVPVVERFGIEAHLLNADRLWSFSNLSATPIQPDFLWINCFNRLLLMVADAARAAGCRVLLNGQFGDALFCEPSLFAADLLRRGKVTKAIRLIGTTEGDGKWRGELLNRGLRPLAPPWLRRVYRRLNPVDHAGGLPGFPPAQIERLQHLALSENASSAPPGWPPGRRMRYHRVLRSVWPHGFAATRSMPHNRCGLEQVSPYFDRRLVEYVLAIPTEEVSTSAQPRKLQKAAIRRLLPRRVAERTAKTSLEPLLIAGLWDREREAVRRLLADARVVRDGWVEAGWLRSALDKGSGRSDTALFLSNFLHLELWLRAMEGPREGAARWATSWYPDWPNAHVRPDSAGG